MHKMQQDGQLSGVFTHEFCTSCASTSSTIWVLQKSVCEPDLIRRSPQELHEISEFVTLNLIQTEVCNWIMLNDIRSSNWDQ